MGPIRTIRIEWHCVPAKNVMTVAIDIHIVDIAVAVSST